MSELPEHIRINQDDDYANLVGRTKDQKQFFITQPFVPHGHDFVVCYIFDNNGKFLEAKIHDLGIRTTGEPPGNALYNNENVEKLQQELLDDLGDFELSDIVVCPFSIESHDTKFGLIAVPPDEDAPDWSVIAEPGNYMAFYPPWDGEYYT